MHIYGSVLPVFEITVQQFVPVVTSIELQPLVGLCSLHPHMSLGTDSSHRLARLMPVVHQGSP